MPRRNERNAIGPLSFDERCKTRVLLGSSVPLLVRVGSALSVLVATRMAFSQSSPVLDLHWDAPSQCPQGGAVQSRIRALVGGTEVRSDQLRAEGRIIQSGDKFHLTLIVRSGSAAGVRVLESDSCDHLTGAAAVGLGLLVRRARTASTPLTSEALGAPSTESSKPGEGPLPTEDGHGAPSPRDTNSDTSPTRGQDIAQAPPAAGLASLNSTAASDPTTSGRKFKVLLRAPSVEFGIGSLPGLSTGYALGAGVQYQVWHAFMSGVYFPRHTIESQWPRFGVDVTRYSVELNGCRAWHSGAFEWAPCIHAGLTDIIARGTGEGILSVRSTAMVWSAGAMLASKLHLAPWAAFFLAVKGDLRASRPRFVNEELGELYRFPILGLEFGLGIEWLF